MKESNTITNRQVLLKSRPDGSPCDENFEMQESPVRSLRDGEFILKTLYLSLDPYMRGRMSDAKSYAPPVELGQVMVGGTLGRVIKSLNASYCEGDLVVSQGGWQEYSISNGEGVIKLDSSLKHPSYALGVLGMPGLAAFMGLLDIGQPKEGETLVVAGATGAVGSLVAQIGKIKGCRVVGVAGGKEKCDYATQVLGLDACVDHKASNFDKELKDACQNGIDIYFENVGGKVFDCVLPLLNTSARIPLCGLISQYNATKLPAGPDRMYSLMGTLLRKRIKMQGFIVFEDYGHRYQEFSNQMSTWFKEGRITYKEDMIDGLENAVQAFQGLFDGKNFGKLVVKVSN